MRKYDLKVGDETFKVYHIGVNHSAVGTFQGGMISSYKEILDNEDEITVESGIGDIRHCIIGDIKEAYEILKDVLISQKPQSFIEHMECVQETILKCFGDYSNIADRLSYFPDDEEIDNYGMEMGKVSDLFHKNAAMCVERAMLSHNLLKSIGIDSTFKMSGFMNNGNPDAHAYNLIAHDGKYYIFDATIPTLRDDIISPIICEIPKDIYDKISNPTSSIGISVHVSHYNPLQKKDYDVTYDAGRNEVYEANKTFAK